MIDLEKFSYKNIQNIEDKIVLLRTCLNVTLDDQGNIVDHTRIKESLPLILELAEKAKGLIITAHLGRPEGRDEKFSFRNNVYKAISDELSGAISQLLITNYQLQFGENIDQIVLRPAYRTGRQARDDTGQAGGDRGQNIFFLENIRFNLEEESEDLAVREGFAKKLASFADVFINDAFADYRESASTYDVAKFLPSYLGPVFIEEIKALTALKEEPKRPYVSVLGGAKLSEKIDILQSFCEKADKILIGGAMAYTLLAAKNIEIRNSKFEKSKIDEAREIIKKYDHKLVLPVDHVVVNKYEDPKEVGYAIVDSQEIKNENIIDKHNFNESLSSNLYAVDIGPKTLKLFVEEISKGQTILWNGPMGVYEWKTTAKGTVDLAKAILENKSAYKVCGGGDSITLIDKYNLQGFNHISTGGGAMLAFLANNEFKTLEVIVNRA